MKKQLTSFIQEWFKIFIEIINYMSIIYFIIFVSFDMMTTKVEKSKFFLEMSKEPIVYMRAISSIVTIIIIIIYGVRIMRIIHDSYNNINKSILVESYPSCTAKRIFSFDEVVEYSKTKYPMEKAHSTDSGFDLKSVEEFFLEPGEIKLISTGIRLALPKGYEAQVRPKSGLSSKGFMVYLGTVDNEYRGEVKVIAQNNSNEKIEIKDGQKIAQIVFNKLDSVELAEILEVIENTSRGDGGFGSTGKF